MNVTFSTDFIKQYVMITIKFKHRLSHISKTNILIYCKFRTKLQDHNDQDKRFLQRNKEKRSFHH